MLACILAVAFIFGVLIWVDLQQTPQISKTSVTNPPKSSLQVTTNPGNCYEIGTCGYCSSENGCPGDKCQRRIHCGAGGDGVGCSPGGVTCEYKDPKLKENYTEISAQAAYACALAYIAENPDNDSVLKEVKLKEQYWPESTNTCWESDPADRFCWYFYFMSERFVRDVNVGAQTCKVYPVRYT